jgi:hypothetical protein
MAIDAELRSGSIDGNEARRRRRALSRESQFYGSMDGAMKVVKSNCSLRLQQSEERPTPSSRAFRCICSVIHPRPRNPEHDFVYRVFRRNLPAI